MARQRLAPTLAFALALTLALPLLLAASARAQDECWDYAEARPSPMAGVAVEHGRCAGESWSIAVNDPNGRSELRWYDDERGVGLELHRPPRFLAWWTDEEGCHLIVYAFGAEELPCAAGDAPSPTVLAPFLP